MTPDADPPYIPPKQERSRQSLARLVEVTARLLVGRRFSELSVNEICEKAGVGSSSFYARFSDKSALLHAVFDEFSDQMRARVDDFERSIRGGDPPFAEFVKGAIALYLDVYQTNRGVIQAFGEAERGDPLLYERRRALDDEIIARLRDEGVRLNPRLGERGLRRAAEIAIPAGAAAIRGALERPSEFGERSIHSRDALVAELAEMALRYLAVAEDDTDGAG